MDNIPYKGLERMLLFCIASLASVENKSRVGATWLPAANKIIVHPYQ